jgi:thioredoxin 1
MKQLKSKKELESVKAGLIVFSATWCGPCKMMAPVIEQLEANPELSEISFMKVDVSESQVVTEEFGVKSVPTIMFVKDGEIVYKVSGVQSKPTLEENLKKLIK